MPDTVSQKCTFKNEKIRLRKVKVPCGQDKNKTRIQVFRWLVQWTYHTSMLYVRTPTALVANNMFLKFLNNQPTHLKYETSQQDLDWQLLFKREEICLRSRAMIRVKQGTLQLQISKGAKKCSTQDK